jgi:hypothetical protein
MDELDMKIQETLKSSQTGEDVVQKIGPIEEEEIMRFLSEHRASGYTPLKVLTGKEITLYGADVNLLSGFALFTGSGNFYGSFSDNCTIPLLSVLQDVVNKGIGVCYHNKDAGGRYFFVFTGIRMKICLRGRILHRYEFEVPT